MSDRLAGRVALVTGASSGIGAACVTRFVEEGAIVAGLDVVGTNSECKFWSTADVRDERDVRQAIEQSIAALGPIDVLVNAAGVAGSGPVHLLDETEWDRIVDINLKGTFLASKHVLQASMVPRQTGSIIHLASMNGLHSMNLTGAYDASKGGVVMLTRQMAVEYGDVGIRVNCLCPGIIDTPMTAAIRQPGIETIADRMRTNHLLGRFGRPEEVAACAAFLASDDASFVTGHALVVDGGYTVGRRYEFGELPDA